MADRKSYLHGILTAMFIAASASGLHQLTLAPGRSRVGTLQTTVTVVLTIGYFIAALWFYRREARRWTSVKEQTR
jgi:hypothetical protein